MFEYASRISRWAATLRANPEWTSALNSAFDVIGFDEAYLSKLGSARRSYNRIKAIKDHIWGMVEVEPADAWVLDSPLFQRMRHIRQTGFTYLTYPNAHHNRFEHSLGVYFVVKRLLATFRGTKEALEFESEQRGDQPLRLKPADYNRSSKEVKLLLHAALLHDAGHAIFSHVSERLFSSNASQLRIGKMTVKQFQQGFKEEYELVESEIQTGRSKPLAELLTVAIITSRRFEDFYRLIPGRTNDDNPLTDLCNISALVLGDRIDPNDFALPEILSGPVDADKIDYMIRDAQACGISIGVDVARVFVRAGTYEGSTKTVEHLNLKGYNEDDPIRLFVIEQSGTDAVRELGSARLSLYERVYNHQLTRGAQAAFNEMILRAADSRDPDISAYADYLTLWQTPEDTVLYALAQCNEPKISSIARSLLTRRLPKRAACFGRDYLNAPEAPVEAVNIALQDAHELRLQVVSDTFLSRLDGALGEKIAADIQNEARRIRSLLARDPPLGVELPNEPAPQICRFLAYPRAHDANPPAALIIRGNRIERFGDRHSSYLYAGETSSQIGYLLVPDQWREIALIAFQTVLYKCYTEKYQVEIKSEASEAESDIRRSALQLDAIFHPSIITQSVARKCKVRIGDLNTLTSVLNRQKYFDTLPLLYSLHTSSDLESIADRFSEFSGEEGWKIQATHVASFVSQFPPSLRAEVVGLLRDENKFLFLNRTKTIALVLDALSRIGNLKKPLRLVPLTASSGQYIRNHIRNSLGPGAVTHTTLSDALSAIETDGGSIVFLDDNIASGTQASRQLDIYMGGVVEKPHGNYVAEKLDDSHRVILKSIEVGAVFSVGLEDGRKKLVESAARHGIKLQTENVQWGKSIADYFSGKGTISNDLRTFLQEIGRSVLERRFRRENVERPLEIANEFSLGYGGIEGLLATASSVPTSTYPAFWCPGIRTVTPIQEESSVEIPWVPLFIRTNMLQHLVLG